MLPSAWANAHCRSVQQLRWNGARSAGAKNKPSLFSSIQGDSGSSPGSTTVAIQLAPTDDEPAAPEHMLQTHWAVLGELEYVLRLCHLEMQDEAPHTSIGVSCPS